MGRLRWDDYETPEGAGAHVQVNSWPPLQLSRCKDWGWQMSNLWVVYRAVLPQGSTCNNTVSSQADVQLDLRTMLKGNGKAVWQLATKENQ